MPKKSSNRPEKCKNCGEDLVENIRNCPTCQNDAGAPNVRACQKIDSLNALNKRFEEAKKIAEVNKCTNKFNSFKSIVDEKSGVVITMPAIVVRGLFKDLKSIYSNYETLVGANIRKPSISSDDQNRFAVGGKLFGHNLQSIIYGALSLSDEGLPTYGEVYCRLRSVTIEKRTSFLETNSYKYLKEKQITDENEMFNGYTSDWENRSLLTLAKLVKKLSSNDNEVNWQNLIIYSDGKTKANDEFIEAHIFEGFDYKAIESIKLNDSIKLKKEDIIDFKIALSNFEKLKKGK